MIRSTVDWRLYVILDPEALSSGASLEGICRAALEGGAGVVQLRDKRSSTSSLVERARTLAGICREYDARFIVNDRVDVALAAGAHGVHLGPDDMAMADARRIAPDLLLGGSAGTVERALQLVAEGADYLGSGAVFDASASKPDAVHGRGTDALRRVVQAVDIPVVGIGGIDTTNARAVAETGAAGAAVIRAICGATDARAAAERLLRAFG